MTAFMPKCNGLMWHATDKWFTERVICHVISAKLDSPWVVFLALYMNQNAKKLKVSNIEITISRIKRYKKQLR